MRDLPCCRWRCTHCRLRRRGDSAAHAYAKLSLQLCQHNECYYADQLTLCHLKATVNHRCKAQVSSQASTWLAVVAPHLFPLPVATSASIASRTGIMISNLSSTELHMDYNGNKRCTVRSTSQHAPRPAYIPSNPSAERHWWNLSIRFFAYVQISFPQPLSSRCFPKTP